MKKITLTILVLIVLALIGGGVYWFLYMQTPAGTETVPTTRTGGFWPFARNPLPNVTVPVVDVATTTPFPENQEIPEVEIPALRKISATPVGGMGAFSIEGHSILRFIDRKIMSAML